MMNEEPENALDRCRANPQDVDAAVKVENIWRSVLLNQFGADDAFVRLLTSSVRLRGRYRNDIKAYLRSQDDEVENVLDRCIEYIARLLIARRHRAASGARSVFDSGLDLGFIRGGNPVHQQLWEYLGKLAKEKESNAGAPASAVRSMHSFVHRFFDEESSDLKTRWVDQAEYEGSVRANRIRAFTDAGASDEFEDSDS